MKIELTQAQINNLVLFLDRVELKGHKEVLAFMEIVNKLEEANKEEVE